MEDKKNIVMWNLFSTYKTVNSLLWTVALICVLSWIAKFSLLFYNTKQEYTEYSATVKDIQTTINGTMVSSSAEVYIPGFGTISLNDDGSGLMKYKKDDKIKIYYHDNNFTLKQPQKVPDNVIKICSIVSIVTLIIWIIAFVADKVLLIPFFRYGGIEAWAYNNLYRKE